MCIYNQCVQAMLNTVSFNITPPLKNLLPQLLTVLTEHI